MKVLAAAILAVSLLSAAAPVAAATPDNVYSPPLVHEFEASDLAIVDLAIVRDRDEFLDPVAGAISPADRSAIEDRATVCTVMIVENVHVCGIAVATSDSCAATTRLQLHVLINRGVLLSEGGVLLSEGWLANCAAPLARPPDPTS
jgi:hypothetical protein